MTNRDFLYKFDNNTVFSHDELKLICLGTVGATVSVEQNNDCASRLFSVNDRWFKAIWFEHRINGKAFLIIIQLE